MASRSITPNPEAGVPMLAVVSGRACSAFLRRGEETWGRLRYETPDVEEPCSQLELEFALQGCADVMTLDVPSEAEALTALFDAVDLTEGVDLTVWLLDGTLSDETRRSVAEELDELLAYAEIREAWEGVFYARPLAEGADVAGARRIASAVSATHVAECLESLAAAQPGIREVRRAADDATLKIGGATDDARQREGFCVREGVYRDLVREWMRTNGNMAGSIFTLGEKRSVIIGSSFWLMALERTLFSKTAFPKRNKYREYRKLVPEVQHWFKEVPGRFPQKRAFLTYVRKSLGRTCSDGSFTALGRGEAVDEAVVRALIDFLTNGPALSKAREEFASQWGGGSRVEILARISETGVPVRSTKDREGNGVWPGPAEAMEALRAGAESGLAFPEVVYAASEADCVEAARMILEAGGMHHAGKGVAKLSKASAVARGSEVFSLDEKRLSDMLVRWVANQPWSVVFAVDDQGRKWSTSAMVSLAPRAYERLRDGEASDFELKRRDFESDTGCLYLMAVGGTHSPGAEDVRNQASVIGMLAQLARVIPAVRPNGWRALTMACDPVTLELAQAWGFARLGTFMPEFGHVMMELSADGPGRKEHDVISLLVDWVRREVPTVDASPAEAVHLGAFPPPPFSRPKKRTRR